MRQKLAEIMSQPAFKKDSTEAWVVVERITVEDIAEESYEFHN